MLRSLFRRPRTVRVPLQNGSVDLQRVAITKRSRSSPVLYRVFTTICVTYFVARTINHYYPDSAHGTNSSSESGKDKHVFGGSVAARQDQRLGTKAGDTGVKNDVIHLMLPIWIRKKKPQPWSHDDPMWKAYEALAADQKRYGEVCNAAKTILARTLSRQYRRHLMVIGPSGSNFRMSVTWIMAPPMYAPANYEVPCIYVEHGRVRYGWRQLPENIGGRMDRIFHPMALSTAFMRGIQEFTRHSYVITKERLRIQLESLGIKEDTSKSSQNAVAIAKKTSNQLTYSNLPESEKDVLLPFLRDVDQGHESLKAWRDVVKSMTYKQAMEEAAAAFQLAWLRSQMKSMQSMTRNCVVIMGNVAIQGERGILFVHAMALYSPEMNALVGHPIIKDVYMTPHMEYREENKKQAVKAVPGSTIPQTEGKQE